MKINFCILIAILFLMPIFLKAENSKFVSIWNQISNGELSCRKISDTDIGRIKSRISCELQASSDIKSAADAIYENIIFEQAGKIQLAKDQCLSEQKKALFQKENDLQFKRWISKLVQAWAALKKTSTILGVCNRLFYTRVEKAHIKMYGLKGAYERVLNKDKLLNRKHSLSEQDEEKWQNICFDLKGIDQLKKTAAVLVAAVPILSKPEFFSILEKHRSVVSFSASGRPLSDLDIASIDISNMQGVSVKINSDPLLRKELENEMNATIERRTEKNLVIKQKNYSDLSSDQKDYLFEEGSVHEVLQDVGEIPSSYSSGHFGKIGSAPACLLARYQPNFFASIAEFGVTSLLLGGVLKSGAKLLMAVPKIYEKINTFKGAISTGFFAVGLKMSAEDVEKQCLSSYNREPKLATNAGVASQLGQNIDEESFNSLTSQIYFPEKEIPSCHASGKGLLTNSFYFANCAESLLANTLPLHISLPGLMLINQYEHH